MSHKFTSGISLLVLGLAGCQMQQPLQDPFSQPTVPAPATGAANPNGPYYPPPGSPGTTSPYGGAPYPFPGTGGTLQPANPGASQGIGGTGPYAPPGGWQTSNANHAWRHSQRESTSVAPGILAARENLRQTIDLAASRVAQKANDVVDDAALRSESLAKQIDQSRSEVAQQAEQYRNNAAQRIRTAADTIKSNLDRAANEAVRMLEPSEAAPPRRMWENSEGEEPTPAPSAASTQPPVMRDGEVRRVSFDNEAALEEAAVGINVTAGRAVGEPEAIRIVEPAMASAAASTPRRFERTSDFRRLRGQLEYSEATGQWKLRYIPIHGKMDAYGGSVVLPDESLLEDYAPGDFVEVQGSIAAQSRQAGQYSPLYALERIFPLEH